MYSTYSLLGLKVITLFVERFWMNFSCCVDCGWAQMIIKLRQLYSSQNENQSCRRPILLEGVTACR